MFVSVAISRICQFLITEIIYNSPVLGYSISKYNHMVQTKIKFGWQLLPWTANIKFHINLLCSPKMIHAQGHGLTANPRVGNA
jgi:hypothetical protein